MGVSRGRMGYALAGRTIRQRYPQGKKNESSFRHRQLEFRATNECLEDDEDATQEVHLYICIKVAL